MRQSVARIGRVRMKAGGADVRVLDVAKRNEVQSALVNDASYLADSGDNLSGYAIVTWGEGMAAGVALKFIEGSTVEQTSIPHFAQSNIARVMRANYLTD
ncbi:hypothetical protein [Litorimonas sp.]|uniref:hypothetical protein n=1 Tax=Litorimonas sp. TaxID=1892381 RepID=UPI003A86DBBF